MGSRRRQGFLSTLNAVVPLAPGALVSGPAQPKLLVCGNANIPLRRRLVKMDQLEGSLQSHRVSVEEEEQPIVDQRICPPSPRQNRSIPRMTACRHCVISMPHLKAIRETA